MEQIMSNAAAQLGAVGLLIGALIFVARFLFVFNMKQLQEQSKKNEALEREFRDHLKMNEKILLEIVDKNTDSMNEMNKTHKKLIEILEKTKCHS